MAIRARGALKSTAEAKRAVLVFIAIAYTLSVALSLLIGLTGGYRSRWIGLGYVSMLLPAVSVLITNGVVRDKQRAIGWDRFPLGYLPLALFLMPLVMHAAMLPAAAALDRLHWQESLTPGSDGLYHAPAVRGWGVLTPTGLAVRIGINAIVGMIVVSTLALFEEIGWRGWLLPGLIGLTSERRAVVISSVIWSTWHAPYALAGIQRLEGVPAGWTALVVPVSIFGSGLVIGWLWLRTRSLWITAIAHGAVNNWGQYAFKFVSGNGQPSDALVLASGGLALIAVGAILLVRKA
jgi:membrane protease YdiL (CAAX protease family)